ncbi:MAG: sigma-54-dependent transcriptional regulator, partial [Nitrospinales bacterium]
MQEKVLIVDDEQKIRKILNLVLRREEFEVKEAASGEEAMQAAQAFTPEIIIMDLNLPDMNGIEAMEKIHNFLPKVITLILTAYGTISSAVHAIKKGAYDYLTKPIDNEELLMIISRALEHQRLAEEVETLRAELRERYRFENIIGVSPKMQDLFERMDRVCRTDATILVQGESGTGKELIIKAMHYNSQRKEKPLVAINCGAVPVNLLESEFFGHEKGAFTDAKERKIGKFQQADGGTLFLDEIGELP